MKMNLITIIALSYFAISCSSKRSITNDHPDVDWGKCNVAGMSSERK